MDSWLEGSWRLLQHIWTISSGALKGGNQQRQVSGSGGTKNTDGWSLGEALAGMAATATAAVDRRQLTKGHLCTAAAAKAAAATILAPEEGEGS
jgi:hypothetical protein